jgi:hypothetical protein
MALEDAAVAHVLCLELQLFPRLAAALDEREALDLVRNVAATREALWLEMRRARPSFRGLESPDESAISPRGAEQMYRQAVSERL